MNGILLYLWAFSAFGSIFIFYKVKDSLSLLQLGLSIAMLLFLWVVAPRFLDPLVIKAKKSKGVPLENQNQLSLIRCEFEKLGVCVGDILIYDTQVFVDNYAISISGVEKKNQPACILISPVFLDHYTSEQLTQIIYKIGTKRARSRHIFETTLRWNPKEEFLRPLDQAA